MTVEEVREALHGRGVWVPDSAPEAQVRRLWEAVERQDEAGGPSEEFEEMLTEISRNHLVLRKLSTVKHG